MNEVRTVWFELQTMVYVLHNLQPFIYLNIFNLPRFHTNYGLRPA